MGKRRNPYECIIRPFCLLIPSLRSIYGLLRLLFWHVCMDTRRHFTTYDNDEERELERSAMVYLQGHSLFDGMVVEKYEDYAFLNSSAHHVQNQNMQQTPRNALRAPKSWYHAKAPLRNPLCTPQRPSKTTPSIHAPLARSPHQHGNGNKLTVPSSATSLPTPASCIAALNLISVLAANTWPANSTRLCPHSLSLPTTKSK